MQSDIGGAHPYGFVGGQREGRAAQFHGIHAEQQMMHDGIADYTDIENILPGNAGLARDVRGECLQRLTHGPCQLHFASGIHHDVGNTAHEILAETNLRVHDAGGRHYFAAGEVAQVRRNGGGAHVHRETEDAIVEPGPHGDDVAILVDGDRDLPIAVTQRRLQSVQHFEVATEALQPPLEIQGLFQTPQITSRVVHVGLLHLDVVHAYRRIQLDVVNLGAFAHHLPVDLALGRYVDDEIAENLRGAAQAPSVGDVILVGVTLLGFAEGRQILGAGRDTVLGELADGGLHLTAAAERPAATNGVDVDTEGTCGIEQRRTSGETAAPTRRSKDDEGFVRHVGGGPGDLGDARARLPFPLAEACDTP